MSNSEDLFADGGRVGALMRVQDWTQSPLGHPVTWPPSLRTVVDLLLRSRFPMFVAWGGELGFLYNDAYSEILGAKHPRAIGRRFSDIWSEIWSDISPLVDATMAGQATYREDFPLVMNRKGYNEQAWFTFSCSPIRDESSAVAGMFCAVSETTQRVMAERAMRESEGRQRELNETLERRVAEALAGLGESMLDVLVDQPDRQAAVKAVWSRALAGDELTAIEEFGDPARDRRAYEMRFNTLRDRNGRQTGAYQFVDDATERLLAQERLHAAAEALRQARKMESLGQLTSGVAHDFNNLLAVFATALQLLERTGQPATPRMLDAMRRAIARGTGLTRQLLAFSRRRAVNPESIDVVAHLTGMRAMLDAALGAQIEIETRFGSGVWSVEADAGEMELAIVNLCVNARDAMPAGGLITIAAENVRIEVDSGTPADFVKISVSDTGVGMPPEVKARVFEPFFTTKDVNKGSGLGLPQVYGFAQQSGGRVEIDSAVGVGTTVTLLVPRSFKTPVLAAVDGDASPPVVVGRAAIDRRSVLLVEGDQEVSAVTTELLTSLGFSVTHVASAEAALRTLAHSRDIDTVVSDVMMPAGTSGLELAREIRRRHPALPILLTTGSLEALGIKDGEFNLLLKPYTVEMLACALGTGRRAVIAP